MEVLIEHSHGTQDVILTLVSWSGLRKQVQYLSISAAADFQASSMKMERHILLIKISLTPVHQMFCIILY